LTLFIITKLVLCCFALLAWLNGIIFVGSVVGVQGLLRPEQAAAARVHAAAEVEDERKEQAKARQVGLQLYFICTVNIFVRHVLCLVAGM
jgi:hypothetical protein